MIKMPKIVCLGGGNAMPKAVLEGLKKYPVRITAVSAMLDSGGFAGRERELFKTKVSFGDIRRAALALSEAPKEKKELFASRLGSGVVLANAYCTNIASSLTIEALSEELKEDLSIPENHEVLPATLDNAQLCAQLENDQIIKGETNIDIPKHNGSIKIKNVFLEPRAKAYYLVIKAIQVADLIVLGPGDLYSSLAQILLVEGIPEALRKSRAKKVYVCNLMTKHGETDDFSVLDFTFEIEKYLGQEIDQIIFNNRKPSHLRIANYKKEHPELVGLVKFLDILDKDKFVGADILADKGPVIHDSAKLAKIIFSLK